MTFHEGNRTHAYRCLFGNAIGAFGRGRETDLEPRSLSHFSGFFRLRPLLIQLELVKNDASSNRDEGR